MILGVYFLQQWFNLSDPAVEDALYDSLSMRRFISLDLGEERAPDETTICRFRNLLERNKLGAALSGRYIILSRLIETRLLGRQVIDHVWPADGKVRQIEKVEICAQTNRRPAAVVEAIQIDICHRSTS